METGELRDATRSIPLKIFFLVCGLSVFARSESVFMQTQMYARCFDLGDRFYALASCAIFMPGILVQIIQNKYDVVHDLAYGTYKATTCRLVAALLGSVAALLGLVLGAYEDTSLEDRPGFIYVLLMILGLGISISFGCFVQVITMFPPSMHPFFFIGTYSPFLIFAPTNVAVQDLCVKEGEDQHWVVRWHSVLVYYLLAAFLTLAGLLCYFGVAKHPLGKQYFKQKDAQLQEAHRTAMARDSEREALVRGGSVNTKAAPLVHGGKRTGASNKNGGDALDYGSTALEDAASSLDGNGGRGAKANGGHRGYDDDDYDSTDDHDDEREPFLNPSTTSTASTTSAGGSTYSNLQMLRMCWREMTSQLLMTVCSTLVASLYIQFKPTTYDDLPTLLQYDYYICGALGILTTSSVTVRQFLTSRVLLIFSLCRLAIIPLAILYAHDYLPRNDIAVLVVNGLQMYVGGGVFALAFSHASNQFTANPDRTKASTIMNTCYYVAMAIALGVSLAIS